MGAYDQWKAMTPAEQAIIALLASSPLTAWKVLVIRNSKDKAFNETTRRFGANGHNDRSDAFRHCFWSATLTRDIGLLTTKMFTDAHETNSGQPADEKEMDLHNNAVGMRLGGFYIFPDSDSTLSEKCFSALQKGELKVLVQ